MFPSPSSMAPTMSILPSWLRPCPPVGGSSLVRNGRLASSISSARQRVALGADKLARSLWASAAVRADTELIQWSAAGHEMPLEWVAIRRRPRTIQGERQACWRAGSSRAVTEVCRRRRLSKVCAFLRRTPIPEFMAARGTDEAVRPAHFDQPGGARVIVREHAARRRGGCRGTCFMWWLHRRCMGNILPKLVPP